VDIRNFRFSNTDNLPNWALFFLELGFFASAHASKNILQERLNITLTVPGAEYAAALIAIGANIQAINADEKIKDENSSSGIVNLDNLSYRDEVMMRFNRTSQIKKGYFKQRIPLEDGTRDFIFGESPKAADDNKFQKINEKEISRLVFPKGTSIDLIDLSPLLRVCCKDINFSSMLKKQECITTLLGIKSHAFDESQENLFYLENGMVIGGSFNDIARFKESNIDASGYYSRIFSERFLLKFLKEMDKNKSRLLILSSKAINTIGLGEQTGEKVRINLLDRSKNIISLYESLRKINQEVAATGGRQINPLDFLKMQIPKSIEIAMQTVNTR